MNVLPDADQRAVADATRDLVSDVAPLEALLALDPGTSGVPAFWMLAAEMGLFGLTLAEELGGAGLGLVEEGLAFKELGRGLAPGPLLGTVLGARVAAAAGDRDLAMQIASGAAVGLVQPVANGLRTLDSAVDRWLVVTPMDARLHNAAKVEPLGRPVDPAMRPAKVDLEDDPVHVVDRQTYDAWRHGALLTAALLAGVTSATRDQSRDYVLVREQFGVAIGSFQAVKHRCADMAVRAEAIDQVVSLASLAIDGGRSDGDLLWPAARLLASRYALQSAGDNIQNHGAIGYTGEHTAHLYLKRAHALSMLFGPEATLREALIQAPSGRVS